VPHDPASTLIIRPVPPFRLDLTVWALRRRTHNAIDRWDGTTYRRVIVVGGRSAEVEVRQAGSTATPRLIVTATPALRSRSERQRVRSAIDRLLGTRVDLRDWYRTAEDDPRLESLAVRFRGMKPPQLLTVFETLVNAFACQQLSLVVGLELLNRLAVVCDVKRGTGARSRYAFPTPGDVVRHNAADYRAIGFSRQKVDALLTLAQGIHRGRIAVEGLWRYNDAEASSRPRELRGVGRWTAEYVLLRGLGRLHVFPGDDVGAQKSLVRWLGRRAPLDYAGVSKATEKWQPYASMVYFHLLLDGLSRAGVLESVGCTVQPACSDHLSADTGTRRST
jgi:DNA-3-methyladenine glycosylase II